jgi:hypothetical protein
MSFMDWEKQDNELRKLMEGSSFLPEGEEWNTHSGWENLQQLKQAEKPKGMPVWLRLAAAACVAGLLGGGFWYLQKSNSIAQADDTFVKKHEPQPLEREPSVELLKAEREFANLEAPSQLENDIVLTISEDKFTDSKQKLSGQVIEIKKDAGLSMIEKRNVMDSPGIELTLTVPDNPGDSKINTEVTEITEPDLSSSLAVVPASAKKSKPRVIHYNQLNGLKSTPPPVFAQTKKSYAEWDGFALQSLSNPKEPPFQLKIDISPSPKKSL